MGEGMGSDCFWGPGFLLGGDCGWQREILKPVELYTLNGRIIYVIHTSIKQLIVF